MGLVQLSTLIFEILASSIPFFVIVDNEAATNARIIAWFASSVCSCYFCGCISLWYFLLGSSNIGSLVFVIACSCCCCCLLPKVVVGALVIIIVGLYQCQNHFHDYHQHHCHYYCYCHHDYQYYSYCCWLLLLRPYYHPLCPCFVAQPTGMEPVLNVLGVRWTICILAAHKLAVAVVKSHESTGEPQEFPFCYLTQDDCL